MSKNRAELKKLYQQIAELLQRILKQEAAVSYQDAMIKVVVSREIFEHRFGSTLHRIQLAIDEEFPKRTFDVAVLVRDAGSRFEHIFKIWKTEEQ